MKNLQKILEKLEKDRVDADNDLIRNINRVIGDVNRLNGDFQEHKYRQSLASNYSQSAAYANIVMLGGYAAAFTIWNILQEELTSKQSVIIGLLLMTSIFFFAGFEVYKMIRGVREVARLDSLLRDKLPLKDLEQGWGIAKDYFALEEARMWKYQIFITVPTGFGAGCYMLSILVNNLVNML